MKIKIINIIICFTMFLSCKENEVKKIENISTKNELIKGISKYNYYKKNGELEKTLEYVNVCGKKYLNQGWYFKNNSDTLFEKSNYYKIIVQKSNLNTMETSKINIFYKPLFKNSISVLLINKNIDSNYCNLKSVKLDTLYFVDNKLEFYQGFKSKGKTNIGGYIFEIRKLPNKVKNHDVYDERKIYLKIPFIVN